MALFKSESEMQEYFNAGIRDFAEQYNIEPKDIIFLIDITHTMMAEYSRLLSEGKIKRPYTFSAPKPADTVVKMLDGGTK